MLTQEKKYFCSKARASWHVCHILPAANDLGRNEK